jgi:DNA-binding XRE family transcriptional regulator
MLQWWHCSLGVNSLSPDQCREARAILKWTRRELADAAGVTLWVVAAFEDGREVLPFYEIEIRAALEAVGIGFPFAIEDGQFKPAGVTYSPSDKDEVNSARKGA